MAKSAGNSKAAALLNKAAQALAEIEAPKESAEELKAARMQKTNVEGGMLMCSLNLAKRPGSPDPLCITVGEEIKYAKRGVNVTVPWYFVAHLKNNVERKFRQEKVDGKNVVMWDDMPGETFSYMPINPAPGVTV